MYLADYHTHTRISPDASYCMDEMAQAAYEAGLQEICFTDHMEPVLWDGKGRLPAYNWEGLAADFQLAREKSPIPVRLGIELGEAVLDLDHTAELLAKAPPLDFIIGSTHMLSDKFHRTDLYYFQPKDEEEALAGIRDYLGLVKKTAQWGGFDVLGHLTLPLRYLNENQGFHLSFDGFEREVEEIFRLVIRQGKGIEMNTNRGNTPLPDEKWLRLYRSLGGEIVTLGSDAHRPAHVGLGIEKGQALLRRCGFTKFCTFENHLPVYHDL